ncbi:MAG: DUF1289 domain-containing protein [Rhodobacter sp.]|nr:DUF1289 domain-containing protein [Rhodobacter sp.]MCY4169687.1 DUF1289 domain-containing protein [Rhodobacter sp.]MCY4240668.1 DUF1289 domain-containing protein [Rhodobacter sp.]
MNDDIPWRRDEVDSPCVRVCVVHPVSGLCAGCLRSAEEISLWSSMTSNERRRIMAELPKRAGKLARRRGGRAARLDRAR